MNGSQFKSPAGSRFPTPNLVWTPGGQPVPLGGLYRGRPAFLICAGPSLGSHDLSQLQCRGILTLAVNNAAAVFRSQLWCGVDDPAHFVDAIWRDPGIMKFVPMNQMEQRILVRDETDQLRPSTERVRDMPAVFGFRRNECFVPARWLYEPTCNWGNPKDIADADGLKGGRSVMYVALRLLFHLGVRQVFLLGCDFRMEFGKVNYAFEQHRSEASVQDNNRSYSILNARFQRLLPYFQSEGFAVHNCTPGSGLTAFPYMAFDDAVAFATNPIPVRILTQDMYGRRLGVE